MNVVISGENRWDNYGNFFFKDKAGNEHKIGEKRKNQVELVAIIENNPGKAVTLIEEEGYGKAKGQFYIVGVELVSEQLETADKPVETPKPTSKPTEPGIRENMEWKDKQIEQKFWWGQLGECLRTKEMDRTTSSGKLLRAAYYAQMFQVLNLKVNKEE